MVACLGDMAESFLSRRIIFSWLFLSSTHMKSSKYRVRSGRERSPLGFSHNVGSLALADKSDPNSLSTKLGITRQIFGWPTQSNLIKVCKSSWPPG